MRTTTIEDARDFGHVVREARKEAGLSQVQLADRCGVSQRFVSEVERGKPTAEIDKALKLLSELAIPVIAGGDRMPLDGRAEVNYAVIRIAESIDERPRKHKKLTSYLEEEMDGR
ncbi:MAG: helix-turn-helix transcriptional regulator [Eggerthellaceae bacterium]|nr:helix-turn-helix transcriptional regulator [Eggerthellaceae bacterium]